jgi:glucose-1-phosphate cytidylyltransferase
MKVVLFCGGRGSAPETMMAPLGRRPLLWHVMRYYAHWGHKDFVLCLGHGGEAIKEYFVSHEAWRSDDFVLAPGGTGPELLGPDTRGWRIAFVDTGAESNTGERLLAIRAHLRGEQMFLANHADRLTDYPLPQLVEDARDRRAVGAFLATRPNAAGLQLVEHDADGVLVRGIRPVEETALRVNGGFFVFHRDIFGHIRPGEDLVDGTLARLAEERLLVARRHDGFWRRCDTPGDLRALEGMMARGPAPWELWRRFPAGDGPAPEDWLGPRLRFRPAAEPVALGGG